MPNAISTNMVVVGLPRGKYLATAKLNVGRTSGSGTANAICSLLSKTGTTNGPDADNSAADNVGANGFEDRAVISLQLPVRIGQGGGSVRVSCLAFSNGVNPVQLTATNVRLAAVGVR